MRGGDLLPLGPLESLLPLLVSELLPLLVSELLLLLVSELLPLLVPELDESAWSSSRAGGSQCVLS